MKSLAEWLFPFPHPRDACCVLGRGRWASRARGRGSGWQFRGSETLSHFYAKMLFVHLGRDWVVVAVRVGALPDQQSAGL